MGGLELYEIKRKAQIEKTEEYIRVLRNTIARSQEDFSGEREDAFTRGIIVGMKSSLEMMESDVKFYYDYRKELELLENEKKECVVI